MRLCCSKQLTLNFNFQALRVMFRCKPETFFDIPETQIESKSLRDLNKRDSKKGSSFSNIRHIINILAPRSLQNMSGNFLAQTTTHLKDQQTNKYFANRLLRPFHTTRHGLNLDNIRCFRIKVMNETKRGKVTKFS